ncbi:MAG: RNase J family beta-CASP ribonuclease, partial [Candidatus Nanopelagicales bacterium]|nr:RNase J family beta-CASP ribonuclease [Candidatus Nanopelagicales bacterium]
FVDGSSVGDLTESSLKDRRILGEEGFVSIFIAVDVDACKVVAGPLIQARGFAETDDVFDDVIPQVRDRVEQALADDVVDPHQLQQVVRRVVGKWVSATHRRRPMIVPVVVDA